MARRSGGFEISEVLLIVGVGAAAYWAWMKYKQSQDAASLQAGITSDMSQTAPPASTALILNPSGGHNIFIPGLDTPGSGGYTVTPGLALPTQPPPGVEAYPAQAPNPVQPAPSGYTPMFKIMPDGTIGMAGGRE